jgi:hypothetical protein
MQRKKKLASSLLSPLLLPRVIPAIYPSIPNRHPLQLYPSKSPLISTNNSTPSNLVHRHSQYHAHTRMHPAILNLTSPLFSIASPIQTTQSKTKQHTYIHIYIYHRAYTQSLSLWVKSNTTHMDTYTQTIPIIFTFHAHRPYYYIYPHTHTHTHPG